MGHDKPSLLAKLSQNEQKRRGKNNRVFLLAHWDEIVEAFSAGWNMRSVWDFLHSQGEFPGGYDTFVKLVRAEQAKLPNAPCNAQRDTLKSEETKGKTEALKQTAHPITKRSIASDASGEFSYPSNVDIRSMF